MFKLYSKGCQYALRILSYVLIEQNERRLSAHDLCKHVGIPEPFSRKVLQLLVQGGLLEAQRGPGGGYRLSRRPDEMTLLDVIYAVDGNDCFDECILGFQTCRPDAPCPLHAFWIEARHHLVQQLEASTLADISGLALEVELRKLTVSLEGEFGAFRRKNRKTSP